MTEAIITRQVKNYLEEFGFTCWFYKVSDRYTSGIPDFIGILRGVPFAIELKDFGKKPRKLQEYVMNRIHKAGGRVIWSDNFEDVKNFLDNI